MKYRLTPRIMHSAYIALCVALTASLVFSACGHSKKTTSGKKTIVVTYSVLGSVVRELVGEKADVVVMVPNGMDIHEWEPSARDIEMLTKADFIVENGLGLEGGMGKALDQARAAGLQFFTASYHIAIRKVRPGEGIPSGDPDQAAGAEDPHLWTDPLAIKSIVAALVPDLKNTLNIDVKQAAADMETKLDMLDKEIATLVNALPELRRNLVTGHESLGYFAERYGFRLIGALVPSLTTEAESSAADFAALKKLIKQNAVKIIFTETGTPARTAEMLAKETGVIAVPLATHFVPEDNSYFTFERNLAKKIVGALGQ